MIENCMSNGVAGGHHGPPVFGFGSYPMAPTNNAHFSNFLKENNHHLARQYANLKVTNQYHPAYAQVDNQAPINLVRKEIPSENAFQYANRGAPFPQLFPYSQSLMGGSFMGHPHLSLSQPHKNYANQFSTPAAPISVPISRYEPPIDVKTSPATAEGGVENYAFKKPDEYKAKQKKRAISHAATPAPQVVEQIPQPMSKSASQAVAPVPMMQSHQAAPAISQDVPEEPKLPDIDRYTKNTIIKFSNDKDKSHVTEEHNVQCNDGELKNIEQVTMEDWQNVASSSEKFILRFWRVKKINEDQKNNTVQFCLLLESHGTEVNLEAEMERPFFVCGRGWTSYLPDRTKTRCDGFAPRKIFEGDVLLALSYKSTSAKCANGHDNAANAKRASRLGKNDLNESHTISLKRASHEVVSHNAKRSSSHLDKNDLNESHTNSLQRSQDIVSQIAKRSRLDKNDLNESRIANAGYYEFTNNAAGARADETSKGTESRQVNENDSNNNKSSAKRKLSAEEAEEARNKIRRWSDPCLEKQC